MPTLDRLTVRGFKSIRALDDFEMRGLNVLIGANGAGKSNFISLFRMLGELVEKRLQRFVRSEGGPQALLYGGRRGTSKIEVKLTLHHIHYRVELVPSGNTLAVASEEARFPEAPMGKFLDTGLIPYVSRHAGRVESVGHYDEEARLPGADLGNEVPWSHVCSSIASWGRVYHFHDTSPDAPVRQSRSLRDNLLLKPDAANLGPFLRFLRERHSHQHRQIVETVWSAAPFFGDFAYRTAVGDQMELEWLHADDPDTPLGPGQLSDGTLRFISLATLLLQPTELQPQLILIDEPELGLHPFALTLLAEMLQAASEARQVVVSTQSADLVSQFRPEDVVVVNRKEGQSVIERLDSERLQDWLKEYSIGQLWKAEVIGGGPAP